MAISCMHPMRSIGCLILLLMFASGCATTGSRDPVDPLEGFNRSVFSFNKFMDENLFDPISNIYRAIIPDKLNRGITNAFSNVNDIAVIANDILQFKLGQAVRDIARFLLNTTLGILGLADVSTQYGLVKHYEDFGQTLARWGFGSGPYLIAPFFGPTTVRDATGFGVDNTFLTPIAYINNDSYRAGVMSLNYIDFKADLLSARDLMEEAALDEYEFMKNAYLERRDYLIHDMDADSFPQQQLEEDME